MKGLEAGHQQLEGKKRLRGQRNGSEMRKKDLMILRSCPVGSYEEQGN